MSTRDMEKEYAFVRHLCSEYETELAQLRARIAELENYQSIFKDSETRRFKEERDEARPQRDNTEHQLHLANDELATIQAKVKATYIKDIVPNLDKMIAQTENKL